MRAFAVCKRAQQDDSCILGCRDTHVKLIPRPCRPVQAAGPDRALVCGGERRRRRAGPGGVPAGGLHRGAPGRRAALPLPGRVPRDRRAAPCAFSACCTITLLLSRYTHPHLALRLTIPDHLVVPYHCRRKVAGLHITPWQDAMPLLWWSGACGLCAEVLCAAQACLCATTAPTAACCRSPTVSSTMTACWCAPDAFSEASSKLVSVHSSRSLINSGGRPDIPRAAWESAFGATVCRQLQTRVSCSRPAGVRSSPLTVQTCGTQQMRPPRMEDQCQQTSSKTQAWPTLYFHCASPLFPPWACLPLGDQTHAVLRIKR